MSTRYIGLDWNKHPRKPAHALHNLMNYVPFTLLNLKLKLVRILVSPAAHLACVRIFLQENP